MSKNYRMKNLGIKALVGRFIKSASINQEKDLIILDTETGKLFLTWEGDCCAHCFIANVSGAEALIGATILEAENAEWSPVKDDRDNCEVIETMGTKIKTSTGYVTIESRVEHNGYYGGYIMVSDDEPMNKYYSPRERENEVMSVLHDF